MLVVCNCIFLLFEYFAFEFQVLDTLQLSGQFVVSLKINNLLPPIKEPQKNEESEFSDRFKFYFQLSTLMGFFHKDLVL